MKFKLLINDPKVSEAALIAERLLTIDSKLMKAILNREFKYDSGPSPQIVTRLLEGKPIEVTTYTPWRFSRAVGMYDGQRINISTRALSWMTLEDVAGLLLHEFSHSVGLTHGNNFPSRDKDEYSVPYFISSKIKEFL